MHSALLKLYLPLGAAALLTLSLAACAKDPDPVIIDPPFPQVDIAPPATTPDQAISNLDWAWEHRNLVEYDKLLDESFMFFFAQTDVNQLGVWPSWDGASELACATRMFTGQPGSTPGGQPLAPIAGFELTLIPDSPSWDEGVPAEHAGTLVRSYDVSMTVTFQGGRNAAVRGRQDFYVAPVQIGDTFVYKLRHWVDFGIPGLGQAKAGDTASWGALKAGFEQQ